LNRIHAGRSVCGHIAGDEGDEEQHARGKDEHQRIGTATAGQETRERARKQAGEPQRHEVTRADRESSRRGSWAANAMPHNRAGREGEPQTGAASVHSVWTAPLGYSPIAINKKCREAGFLLAEVDRDFTASFGTKTDHRIGSRCSHSRNQARENRDCQQDERASNECDRIVRAHTEELGLNQAGAR
jgi:hypothetical protein